MPNETTKILGAIDALKIDLNDKLNDQNEEIRLNKRTSTSTARAIDTLTHRWNELEAQQEGAKLERAAEIAKLGAEIKSTEDAQKAADEILSAYRKRAARRGSDSDAAQPSRRSQRQDLRYRIANLGAAFLVSDGYKTMLRDVKGGARPMFRREFTPAELRADFIHTLADIGDLRDTLREAAVFDPLRPATLRDLMSVVPVSGAITTYPRELYWHPITSAADAVTLAAATPTDIAVDNSSGFRVGSIVYGDVAMTKFGTVNSIDVAAATVNVTSAAGFTLAADDQLWSTEFTPTPEGLDKPCAELKITSVNVTTKTIAEIAAVSRQSMRDIQTLMRIMNGRLANQITVTEEDQILFGSGTDPEFTGLMNTPGINTYLKSAVGGQTELDALRRAKTPITEAYHAANAVILSPALWETIELSKGSDLRYIFQQAPLSDTQVPLIWKLRVVETTAMVQNASSQEQALVGDYRNGAAIREREGMNFAATDAHADFFVRNLVALRAEIDSGVDVYYPQAFTKVTMD